MEYKNIEPEEFKKLKEENPDAVILDVRTPPEKQEGYIPGYQMVNFNDPLFPDKLEELDKDKTYLVYCRSGNRSGQACRLMKEKGFKTCYNLDGGIIAWNTIFERED